MQGTETVSGHGSLICGGYNRQVCVLGGIRLGRSPYRLHAVGGQPRRQSERLREVRILAGDAEAAPAAQRRDLTATVRRRGQVQPRASNAHVPQRHHRVLGKPGAQLLDPR